MSGSGRRPAEPGGRLRVWTVGHSTHPFDVLLGLLRQPERDVVIDVLVDVRSQPYSRFAPQHNREPLERAVSQGGIRYLFMGEELGGRLLGRFASLDERLRRYPELARLPAFQRGIGRLVSGAGRYRVAILCAEEDPTECHCRVWVTPALRERGVEVLHIRGDGRLEGEEPLRRLEPPSGEQLPLL